MVSWTKEQEQAIYDHGRDMLVSAAAGSGKTAVLVERIIQKVIDRESPVDIHALLVVTFTNAAAQEMRNRVTEALNGALEQNPGSLHLKKQLSLVQSASISTLHSFCLEMIRKYAYLLDLDPAFRISDDVEADLMKQEVLEELLEDWYGKEGEERREFFELVDRFSGDRHDLDVESLILQMYTFSEQHPWPETWLEEVAEMYNVTPEHEEADLPWFTLLKREVHHQLDAMEKEAEEFLSLTRQPDGPYTYGETADKDLALIREAKANLAISWQSLEDYVKEAKFPALSRKKSEVAEEKKEEAKDVRERYKKRFKQIQEEWFARPLTRYLEEMGELYPVVRQLTVVVRDFKQRYQEKKKEKAVVDFSDLEHFALEILRDGASTPDNLIPSSVAKGYQRQFTEVLVDEYQDTNLVQETLLRLLTDSSEAGDLFMVGDVKQSIYRFRHAEPSLFLEKYRRFQTEEDEGKRIDLARNFRSRHQVLNATNYLFRQILDEEVGEMDYEEEVELIYGNTSYEDWTEEDTSTELVIVDREDPEEEKEDPEEEDFRDLEKAQLEARTYARKIRAWLGYDGHAPMQIVDKESGMPRPVKFRDIVLLQRSMTWAPVIVDELKQQGIPVYAELSTGYFEAIEIRVMISLLKTIDNPKQDIPLASVLRSPIVGLDEDELARIRLADKKAGYYEAMKAYRNTESDDLTGKLDDFLETLHVFRERARQGALSELIWDIFRETGYYDFAGGMPGGRQRQANLRALYDRAKSYESTSFRGLFRFLRFIERMEERGDDLGAARALGEQEDVVRIMTIHKSKGLEFPIVILGGIDKQFNMRDLHSRYLLHKDLGFGSKYIDPKRRLIYPTIAYHALREKKKREILAEEMRVLYVALTRAKEKLVLVGNVPSFQKKQDKWKRFANYEPWMLPASDRLSAKSYLDWIGPSLIRHHQAEVLTTEDIEVKAPESIHQDESEWNIDVIHGSELSTVEEDIEKRDEAVKEAVEEWKPVGHGIEPFVEERLDYKYPYEQAARRRAKQTVTEIKRKQEIDEYADTSVAVPYRAPMRKRPKFMQQEKSLTAAERGTAMHTVMQHIPLRPHSPLEVAEEVERLVEREVLTRDEADVIDTDAISRFFDTEIGELTVSLNDIERETAFNYMLPAKEIYADWEGDEDECVFIQGIIDLVLPYKDGYILLDYKTDQLDGSESEKKLADRYRTQIAIYTRALESIRKKKVHKRLLYFFDAAKVVEVEGE
ncbi:helicase-exonuclease AddAB subunit AddA [Salimicrobium halophilum]|uniref:ATP-dependent helicase/nuclease subunit A n=1 Tax=Salimicrobium halophilum TaxID=86666 RepID=A0A1G8TR01_9BACI|nr:helicase-exonuclease AddAB subunit AddA [Salimicrobium halophilum]SDJ43951.1 DNA helicase/exodeoxyribonuclease V, subunit A [Salimicrobium halophilum]